MKDGTITLNNAAYEDRGSGGGVYNEGTFAMPGGTITKNTANVFGGGVYVPAGSSSSGTISLGGNVSVSGNTAGSSASNIFIFDGDVISITEALTGTDGAVGVTKYNGYEKPGTGLFAAGSSGYTITDGDKEKFSSDEGFGIGVNTAGAYFGYDVSFDGGGASTEMSRQLLSGIRRIPLRRSPEIRGIS